MHNQGFFEKCSLGGEIAFVGRENVKNIQKTNKICYCLGGGGGGNLKLRGEIPPPPPPPLKALKKHCAQCVGVSLMYHKLEAFSEDVPHAVLWYICGTKWP